MVPLSSLRGKNPQASGTCARNPTTKSLAAAVSQDIPDLCSLDAAEGLVGLTPCHSSFNP